MLDFHPRGDDHRRFCRVWSPPVRAFPLLLAALLAGCVGPRAGTREDKTSDAAEMYARFQEEVRGENVAQQYYYYSRTFKKRYNLFEYGLMVNGDPVIGGLFRTFVLDWRVTEVGYARDHKSGWIALEHPKYPQYRKVLDTVAEYDEKLKADQWKIDFGCAKWMNLPDALEARLIEEEEKYREKARKARGTGGVAPKEPSKEEEPKAEPSEEAPHE